MDHNGFGAALARRKHTPGGSMETPRALPNGRMSSGVWAAFGRNVAGGRLLAELPWKRVTKNKAGTRPASSCAQSRLECTGLLPSVMLHSQTLLK
jgi:hypothetical protein